MLASQLIYTSWKNGDSPNKGYMVYSKSKDITEVESSEIQSVMRYNPPTNLPYTPTQEQIETIFPKNFAYFRLSSGRLCIAQSCYIGQDYTGRWGNYIIHAYVLADTEEVIPQNLIGQNLFRTCLTEEELNAPAAPAFLPQVELECAGTAMSQQEAEQLLDTPEKQKMFRYLAQNALTAVVEGKRILFYEGMEQIPAWIRAMALVLPRSVLKKLYFSTYSIDASDLITFSCMLPDSNAGGGYTFDTNLISIYANQGCEEDGAGTYIQQVCALLRFDYYKAILCAADVNNQLAKYQTTDCDRVMKLIFLKNGSYAEPTVQELASLLETLYQYDRDQIGSICENVFRVISTRTELQTQEGALELYRKIYPDLSNTAKEDLLVLYLHQMLGDCDSLAPQEAYEKIKASCPCDWMTALKSLIKESVTERIKSHNTLNSEMLMVFAWLDVFPLCKGEASNALLDKVKPYYQKYVSQKKVDLTELILQRCKALSDAAYVVMIKSITETDLAFFAQDVDYLFAYLERALSSAGAFWSVLCKVVYLHPTVTDACIAAYVNLLSKAPEQGILLNRMAEQHEDIKNFVDAVALYEYGRMPVKSVAELQQGYSRYVQASYGTPALEAKVFTLFLSKLRTYYAALGIKDQIRDGLYLYQALSTANPGEKEQKVLGELFEVILKDRSFAEIEKFMGDGKTVWMLAKDAAQYQFHAETLLRARMYVEGDQFKLAATEDRNRITAVRFLKNNEEVGLYCFQKSTPPRLLAEFAELYFEAVLKTVYAIYDMGESNHFDDLLHTYILPFYTSVPDYEKRMQKAWKKDALATNEHLKLYVEYVFTQSGAFRDHLKDHILEDYLDGLGSKRKDVFNALEKSLENKPEIKEQFQRYAEAFNKNHIGWFGKLFGGKTKKGENDNEQK